MIKELTTSELNQLVQFCLTAEKLRSNLKNEITHNLGIEQAIKIMKKFKDVSYNGIRIESGYDNRSRNWFTVCYKWCDNIAGVESFWASEDYNYSGTRESCSIGHIWAILEKFNK